MVGSMVEHRHGAGEVDIWIIRQQKKRVTLVWLEHLKPSDVVSPTRPHPLIVILPMGLWGAFSFTPQEASDIGGLVFVWTCARSRMTGLCII